MSKTKIGIFQRLKSRFSGAALYQGPARLRSWPVWVGIFLWLAISMITVLSFQSVHWTNPQPSYILVLGFAVVLALISVRWNKPVWFTALISLAVGIGICVWQTVILFKAPVEYNLFKSIDYAFTEWTKALVHNSPNENNIYFSLFLIIVTWVWGYLGTWRLVRQNSVWLTVFFGLIIMLVNLAFLSKAYFGFFYAYLFLSIGLISYSYFIKQNYHNGLFPRLPARISIWIASLIVVFGGILILITGLSPEIRSDRLRTLFETNLKQSGQAQNLKINIFNSVSSKGTVVKNNEQNEMRFSSHPNLSEEVQFRITSTGVPNYWRVRRYDTYNSWGWSTSPYESNIVSAGEPQPPTVTAAKRFVISYTVYDKIKTDIILSSGKFLFVNAPSIIHYYETAKADIAATPDDNLVSVSTPHIYQVDDSYTVNSEIIRPTIDQLKAAGSNYPTWIKDQYLQLPVDLPLTVTRLDRNLLRGFDTQYDKVLVIANYLSRFKYVLEGSYPPDNKDAVEDFLLVQKTGNCTNFASAAVVLLRSAGIPARFCTGYIPHYVDKAGNTFVVLAKDYHAWPEVYFPGYGWIEFEVTPGTASGNIIDEPTGNTLPGLSSANINDFPPYFPVYSTPAPLVSGNPAVNSQKGHGAQTGLTIALILLIIAALIAVYITWHNKMKRDDTITGIMARMHLFSPLAGVPVRNSQTIQEYASELSARLPDHRHEIEKLAQSYQVSRYSRRKMVILQDEYLLLKYWRSVFWGLIKRALWRF